MFLRMNFLAEVADSRHHTLNFSLHYVSIFAVPELASSVITIASTWLRLSVSPNSVVIVPDPRRDCNCQFRQPVQLLT